MTDEPNPTVRDPRGPANMLADTARSQAAYPQSSNDSDTSADLGAGSAPSRSRRIGTPAVTPIAASASRRDSTSGIPAADGTATLAPPPAPHAASADSDDLERGLAQLDPLSVHPRTSSRVMCLVLGVLLLALAAVVWWLGVRTETGQSYDEIVVVGFSGSLPGWAGAMIAPFNTIGFFSWLPSSTDLAVVVSVALGVISLVVMIVRRRWWAIGQSAVFAVLCYAASLLKNLLPRPFIINTQTPHSNSAPSGHTILAMAAGMVLLFAVPRVWRAVCALIASAYGMTVGLSVIAGGWHRPTDVVMAMLIVGGLAMLTLAATRTSGMDEPGRRVSSMSIQIVGAVMVTAGVLVCIYAVYVIWQIAPGLQLSAQWSQSGAHISTFMAVTGTAVLVSGLVLAMRQLTAAPLTRIGLIGAPPAPPRPLS